MQSKEQSQATERKRASGLKRWLSLKNINAAYKRAEASPRADKALSKEQRILVRNRNRVSEHTAYPNHPVTVKATKIEISPVDRPASAKRISHTDSQRENNLLTLLLQRELKSPKVSPAAVPELLSPDIAQLPLAPLAEESEPDESGKVPSSTRKPKSNPPRRKRSLIYAMYCTAKSEDSPAPGSTRALLEPEQEQDTAEGHSHDDRSLNHLSSSLTPPFAIGKEWDHGSQSMVTIDNGSTAFVSCTSMPSLRAGYGSVQSQSGRQQPISCRNNESIQDVLADVAAQLSISASRPASLIDSEEESEYVTGSDISSRSSFIDAIAVEPAAYRCSGRFAPRLSTIERGKDGRLLIKPNGDCAAKDSQTSSLADLSPKSRMLASIAKADCSGAVDSGNESAADASPSPKTPPAVASGSLQSGQTRQYMVEEFPPVPDINGCARDRCAAARGPKDPMLMHNIRPSDDLDAKRSDALLSASLDDLVAKTVSASGESRPRSSTSPPSISPEKSRSITANTSVDTAETAKADSTPVMPLEQKADGNSLSGQPGVGKPEGKIDADSAPFVSLSEILVTSKRPQSGSLSSLSQSPSPSPSPRSLSGSLSPAKVQQENNLVCGNNSNVAAPAAAAETVASATDTGDAQPSRGLRSRHQMSIRRSTGLGGIANDSNQSTNSNMLSIFSDISESDMLFFDGSRMQQQGPPHFADGGFSQQLSLLFDGRPHSMLDDCSLTSVYSDADKSRRYLSGTATVEKGAAEAVARAPSVFVSGDLRTNRDGNFDDDDDDELALSDIIAINQAVISPPPTQLDAQIALSAPTSSNCRDLAAVSPQHVDASGKDAMGDSGLASSIASRTRKLSTALGSIRNLHRKIRGTASQSRSTGSGNSRHRNSNSNSDNASSSGSADAAAAGSDGSGADGYQPKQQQQQQQATKKTFRFNELVAVYETWNREEYDRKGMPSTKLDAEIIEQIKYELNEFKVYEMQVHEDSRRYTHFIY